MIKMFSSLICAVATVSPVLAYAETDWHNIAKEVHQIMTYRSDLPGQGRWTDNCPAYGDCEDFVICAARLAGIEQDIEVSVFSFNDIIHAVLKTPEGFYDVVSKRWLFIDVEPIYSIKLGNIKDFPRYDDENYEDDVNMLRAALNGDNYE